MPKPGKKRMQWHPPPQKHLDTVVFVHGILGDYLKTWGKFPELVTADDDLPQLDILLWGYRTGWFTRHNKLHLEGGHLCTALEGYVQADNDIVLVGHSMGGLVILKGLIDRMILEAAQKPPCHAVIWISLFACPLSGVWFAGLVTRWLLIPLKIINSLHKHVPSLAPGKFVNELVKHVKERIYAPMQDNIGNRKIPIRIISATRDLAVDEANRDLALAAFTNPAPHQLDETHSSVKLPQDAQDLRYRVLAVDLQSAFRRRFKRLSLAAMDTSTSEADRAFALYEILRRYGKIIRRRVRDNVRPTDAWHDAENQLLLLLANYGAIHDLPPHLLVDRAIRSLIQRRPEWQ
jgi:hypothetical protein